MKKNYENYEELEHWQYIDSIKKEFAENNGVYIEINLKNVLEQESSYHYLYKQSYKGLTILTFHDKL